MMLAIISFIQLLIGNANFFYLVKNINWIVEQKTIFSIVQYNSINHFDQTTGTDMKLA